MRALVYVAIIGAFVCSCAKQPAQPLITGRWEGYHVFDFRVYDTIEKVLRDSMKLIIEINQVDDSTLTCKTYSGEFEAEAIGIGKFNAELGTLSLSETKIEKIKGDTTGIEWCLANYSLQYKKLQSEEQLIGTTKSQPSVNGIYCGDGDIHLKRVKN